MIYDKVALAIIQRPDLDKNDKAVLLDILARQPKPEKVKGAGFLGQTELRQGMAKATVDQIAARTGLGKSTTKNTIRSLKDRKLIRYEQSKGHVPSRYLITL